MKKYEQKRIVKRKLRDTIEKQSIEKEEKNTKLRHQRHKKYERQKYLGEVGIKTAREIIKTKLEMWNVGSNFGMEMECWCGEKELSEHVLECKKVGEIIEKKGEKEWMVSKRSEDLMRATEYMKAYLEKRKECNKREELFKGLAHQK